MPKLKSYEDNQKEKHVETKNEPSGVACSCKNVPLPNEKSLTSKKEDSVVLGDCPGEMMFMVPKVRHPQLPDLYRASCGCCNWQGWV